MSMAALNPFMGEQIQTNVPGVTCGWSQVALFSVTPLVASAVSVLAATALTAGTQAIIAGITNPDLPRNISIKGNASGNAGTVTIKGTDYAGNIISENIVINGTAVVNGLKAFMTVTEIDLPIQTHGGDTLSVGVGSALGLPFQLRTNTVLAAYQNTVKEGTAPTVTIDSTNICNNTITLNSALTGTQVDAFLIIPS